MGNGEKLDKQKTLIKIKIGDYIKWRALPIDEVSESVFAEFKSFVGVGNEWQYGLVLDILDCPRNSRDIESIRGLHVQLLKGNEIDWIFNFELFNEIEIVGHKEQ